MSNSLLHVIREQNASLGQRLLWTMLLAIATFFLVAIFLGPFERFWAIVTLCAPVALLAWAVGFDSGRKRRRFISLRGDGLQNSQSIGKSGDHVFYSTYDVTQSRVDFVLDRDAINFAVTALEARTISDGDNSKRPIGERLLWPGTWLFVTYDSRQRPSYFDAKGIIEMLTFLNSHVKNDAMRREVREALSEIADGLGDDWQRAFLEAENEDKRN